MNNLEDKKERVAIFVDGDNFIDMIDIIRQRQNTNIDIKKLFDAIADNRLVKKIFMIISTSPDGRMERPIHATIMNLRQNRVQVVTVPQIIQTPNKLKGYSDCQLVCEMIKFHEQYDTAIIVTRDGDFQFVAQLLSDSYQKRIEICGIPIFMNNKLLNCSNHYWNIIRMLRNRDDIIYQGKYEEIDIEDEDLTEEEDPSIN